MIERLIKLRDNKSNFKTADELYKRLDVDTDLRNEIEALSRSFLSRQVNGCKNCYFDAYMELINLKIEKAMEKINCQFKLFAGVLLQDTANYNSKLLCTNANLTDELALYHLRTNPSCRKYFEVLPKNVEILIIGEPTLDKEEDKIQKGKKVKVVPQEPIQEEEPTDVVE